MEYFDIPMWLSFVFMLGGLAVLAWSSDVFVDGASIVAKALGISPFVIGMVIIGFGTSAPELCVSVMSGVSGHANLSLGNAYGSAIFNIFVILGLSAVIFPIVVKPAVSYVAGPGLTAISLFSIWILSDGVCSRTEAWSLLGGFAVALPAYCWFDQKTSAAETGKKAEEQDEAHGGGVGMGLVKVVAGLGLLMGSSHLLVWGAVDFAKAVGVSDLVIGLTIVAAGTSLPELASAIASARRGEHEFVLGNIIGSNLFNTLAVVGLATAISPLEPTAAADGAAVPAFSRYVLWRDLPVMVVASLSITLFGLNRRHLRWPGVIKRWQGWLWMAAFAAYTLVMFFLEVHGK